MRSLLQLPGPDPGRFALKAALRAALVLPAVFAFTDLVIGNRQSSVLAAFGSIAMLILVDFGGGKRARLLAYVGLTVGGAVLITIGTLCSRDPWLAAGAAALVGFAILFAGVLNGWVAAAANPALVTFILPVAIDSNPDVIPDRLLGWGVAAVACTTAHFVLWPGRPRDRVRNAAAGACRALAGAVEIGGEWEPGAPERRATAQSGAPELGTRLATADSSLEALDRQLLAGPYRPSGSTGSLAWLALLSDELAWFRAALDDEEPEQVKQGETTAAVAAVLRDSASALTGSPAEPDQERLRVARHAQRDQLTADVAEMCTDADDERPPANVRDDFRSYTIARSARRIGYIATAAAGRAASPAIMALEATQRLAVEHTSPHSAWFRNSVRGAVALAVAVFVAQQAGTQQAYWIVLGTLSVLRSSAFGTGSTILQALAGTAVGIVVGGVIVSVIPTGSAVLWAVLPFAVLLAAYAPRVVSFAAGQAGFTLVLVLIFNLQRPIGWEVGLVRAEDVGMGFAISLLIGLLFWPRGAASLLRASIESAYVHAAELLAAARRLLGDADPAAPATLADGREVERAEREASAAVDRLEDTFRQYLAERPSDHLSVPDVAVLVAGARRVRRTARALLDGRVAAAPLQPPERGQFTRVWTGLYLAELERLQRRLVEPAAQVGVSLAPVDAAEAPAGAPAAATIAPATEGAARRLRRAARVTRR